MKICFKCKIGKILDDFHYCKRSKDGHVSICKECQKKIASNHYLNNKDRLRILRKKYYEENKQYMLLKGKEYYLSHKEEKSESVKKWRADNPEKISKIIKKWTKENKDKMVSYATKWKQKNPEKVSAAKKGQYERYKKNPAFILSGRISNSIRHYLKKGGKLNKHWEDILDFTSEDLKKHIEMQFKDGMTWDKFLKGQIHIDHKIPVSVFNFDKPEDYDFKRCWSLENLQPMWAKDNMSKGAKLEKHFQPSLSF